MSKHIDKFLDDVYKEALQKFPDKPKGWRRLLPWKSIFRTGFFMGISAGIYIVEKCGKNKTLTHIVTAVEMRKMKS